jgi:hypothetical protein
MLHLEEVLQRLYNSRINIDIMIDRDEGEGFQFAFASIRERYEAETPTKASLESFESSDDPQPWTKCETAAELAESIHKAAIAQFPAYARRHAQVN